MSIGPGHYAVLSAVVFAAGCAGVIARRELPAMLVSVGVMFTGPVIALAGFSELGLGAQDPPKGSAFALVGLAAMTAQLAVAVALVMLAWRRRDSVDADDLGDLRG